MLKFDSLKTGERLGQMTTSIEQSSTGGFPAASTRKEAAGNIMNIHSEP